VFVRRPHQLESLELTLELTLLAQTAPPDRRVLQVVPVLAMMASFLSGPATCTMHDVKSGPNDGFWH
jgi:hypothetical protein